MNTYFWPPLEGCQGFGRGAVLVVPGGADGPGCGATIGVNITHNIQEQ